MGVDIFGINVDKPSREYWSGENVTGKVFLRISGVETTSEITIRFFGTADTHWHENYLTDTGYDDNNVTNTYGARNYFGHETIFDISARLFGDGNRRLQIPVGDNVYPFTFQVPKIPLPASCTFDQGDVTYGLQGRISDHQTPLLPVTILPIVDLNLTPGAANPKRVSHCEIFSSCCCSSKPCLVQSFTPKSGFCPGEMVPLVVEFQNQSDRSITDITATLIQEWTLIAYGFYGGVEQKKYPTTLLESSRPNGVGSGETTKWEVNFTIPPKLPPTNPPGTSEIVKLDYMININAVVIGCGSDKFSMSHPLIIGTIPLKGNTVLQQQIPKYNQKGALA